jgi:hypothetical protein
MNTTPIGAGIQELVASVRSNVEVVRDAMKDPATEDSHAIVSDLMLEIKQSQDTLQKRATELAESGQFDKTNDIFETIDLVTNLEPEYERWSRPGAGSTSQPAVGVSDAPLPVDDAGDGDENQNKKKKKKKKKKRDSGGEDGWGVTEIPAQSSQPIPASNVSVGGGWEAFPAPPGESVTLAPIDRTPPVIAANISSAPVAPVMKPATGRLTLGMNWDTIGPLIGDPGSSDDVRKSRLGELVKEAIANECGLTLDRIRIKSVS